MIFVLTAGGCGSIGSPAASSQESAADSTAPSVQTAETDGFEESEADISSTEGIPDSSQDILPTEHISDPAGGALPGETGENGGDAAVPEAPQTSAPGKKETQAGPLQTAAQEKTEAESAAEHMTMAAAEENQIHVTFSVDCKTAVEKGSRIAQAAAPDGVMYSPAVMKLEKGATVYDALMNSGLVVKADSSPFGVYVSSIQSLREKDPDCGGKSGWLFIVNGVVSGTSCSNYVLKDGDTVQWRYTCDMGKDLQ